MRVPCIPYPTTDLTGIEEQIVQRIATRRAEHGLLPLDLVLLHAPEIANGGCDTTRPRKARGENFLAIQYEMTKNINPTDETFENLRSVCGFSNQEIVELTATVSAYNFAS
ncbi:hypothetical protein FocTR4_00011894, partial [Fusarium oxysporum f. sp. cubense]